MRKLLCCMSALALASALSACGGREEPASNVVAEEPTGEPAAPAAAPQPAAKEKAPAAKPAATKPEPAKPKPAEPAEPAEPVEKAPTPACAPEHRAAGHC